jgi:hypothetical protein
MNLAGGIQAYPKYGFIMHIHHHGQGDLYTPRCLLGLGGHAFGAQVIQNQERGSTYFLEAFVRDQTIGVEGGSHVIKEVGNHNEQG